MPKKQFAIEKGGAKRIEVSWKAFWKNFEVRFDGQIVGTANGLDELKAGKTFSLPDGSSLQVQYSSGFGRNELGVYRDGVPLPGSDKDPETVARTAAILVYVLAGLNMAIGIALYAFDVGMFKEALGGGAGLIAVGLIFAVLGFFTMRRSRIALILATILYAIDGIAALMFSVGAGRPNVGMLFVRVIFLFAMIRGVTAMNELKAKASNVRVRRIAS